jgi:hypothetical protein
MRFHLTIFAIGTLFVSPLMAVQAQAQTQLSQAQSTSSFIVLCDCATHQKRARIQRAIQNAGGRIVYTYENLGGFAVGASKSTDPARLEQKLRRIPGVTSVEPDGFSHTTTQN